jgi:phage tail-like protein
MIVDPTGGFLYLNDATTWSAFVRHDVDVSDGMLTLAATGSGHALSGAFLGGPFSVADDLTSWFRLEAETRALPAGGHFQFFTAVGQTPPSFSLASADPFPGWHAAPRDEPAFIIPDPADRQLWVGGVLRGDGTTSPGIRQLRADYGRDTYARFLPAIYRREAQGRDLVERLLALAESSLGDYAGRITDLPRLFDPMAAPSDGFPSWLEWLSGWLAFELNGRWSDDEARAALAEAFVLHGSRGTVAGLRRHLKLYAGVEAHVTEHGASARLWMLGGAAGLGFQTMLAPASYGGAILGSAVLDRSNLEPADDRGASLLEDVAHHFCVEVYCAELTRPGALDDVRHVVRREKPAHTVGGVRLIDARMRVGLQARVGVDAIVAAGPRGIALGQPLAGVALTDENRGCQEVA